LPESTFFTYSHKLQNLRFNLAVIFFLCSLRHRIYRQNKCIQNFTLTLYIVWIYLDWIKKINQIYTQRNYKSYTVYLNWIQLYLFNNATLSFSSSARPPAGGSCFSHRRDRRSCRIVRARSRQLPAQEEADREGPRQAGIHPRGMVYRTLQQDRNYG
jgi:hypothetical protein